MRVRTTTEADLPLLAEIERSAGRTFDAVTSLGFLGDGSVQTEANHRRWMAGGASWVATDADDAPIGFLAGEVFGDDLHLWELDVRFEHQKRGAGRALIETAKAWAQSRRLTRLTLTTFVDVPWNAPFYASCGFERMSAEAQTERLLAVRALETSLGLPAHLRCAMAYAL